MVDVNEQMEKDFVDYIEHQARKCMEKAEMELTKMKECQDVLELPSRKENWSAQENAETDLGEHMVRVFSYLEEVAMLTKGLEIFKEGLIYGALKDNKILKKKVDLK